MSESENELMIFLIDNYANLQRIVTADDPKKEAEYQLKFVAEKLKILGVKASVLDKL